MASLYYCYLQWLAFLHFPASLQPEWLRQQPPPMKCRPVLHRFLLQFRKWMCEIFTDPQWITMVSICIHTTSKLFITYQKAFSKRKLLRHFDGFTTWNLQNEDLLIFTDFYIHHCNSNNYPQENCNCSALETFHCLSIIFTNILKKQILVDGTYKFLDYSVSLCGWHFFLLECLDFCSVGHHNSTNLYNAIKNIHI